MSLCARRSGSTLSNFTKFSVTFPMAVSSGGIVTRYMLLVLCISSFCQAKATHVGPLLTLTYQEATQSCHPT